VTADHSTSCVRKAHTADPVPLLVAGPGVAADSTASFGETEASRGALGTLMGVEIVPNLVGLMRS
jgi:2,3-bisphosphoglycerate-independent phosphoglycerate mutase